MISAELMYEKVMHRMDMTKETKEEELQEIIRTVLEDESKKEFIPLGEWKFGNRNVIYNAAIFQSFCNYHSYGVLLS